MAPEDCEDHLCAIREGLGSGLWGDACCRKVGPLQAHALGGHAEEVPGQERGIFTEEGEWPGEWPMRPCRGPSVLGKVMRQCIFFVFVMYFMVLFVFAFF